MKDKSTTKRSQIVSWIMLAALILTLCWYLAQKSARKSMMADFAKERQNIDLFGPYRSWVQAQEGAVLPAVGVVTNMTQQKLGFTLLKGKTSAGRDIYLFPIYSLEDGNIKNFHPIELPENGWLFPPGKFDKDMIKKETVSGGMVE